jgi:hypothetical protein
MKGDWHFKLPVGTKTTPFITSNFLFSSNHKIVEDYVEK